MQKCYIMNNIIDEFMFWKNKMTQSFKGEDQWIRLHIILNKGISCFAGESPECLQSEVGICLELS